MRMGLITIERLLITRSHCNRLEARQVNKIIASASPIRGLADPHLIFNRAQ